MYFYSFQSNYWENLQQLPVHILDSKCLKLRCNINFQKYNSTKNQQPKICWKALDDVTYSWTVFFWKPSAEFVKQWINEVDIIDADTLKK